MVTLKDDTTLIVYYEEGEGCRRSRAEVPAGEGGTYLAGVVTGASAKSKSRRTRSRMMLRMI